MNFFNRSKQQRDKTRQPDESQRLTENLVANLWVSDGGARLNWNLGRLDGDGEKVFRTFLPSNMLELVEAQAKLAGIFAQAPKLSSTARSSLAELSKLLQGVVEMVNASGEVELANGKADTALLAASAN